MSCCRDHEDTYTADDLKGTLRAVSWRWRWLLQGLDGDARAAVQPALDATAAAVGAASSSLDDIDAAATTLPEAHRRTAVHATEHALSDAGRALAAHRVVPSHTGVVAGVFTSGGGVPKLPIAEAVVGRRGVAGDRQAARLHHGRVFQALCLWSADVVDALAAEGHPIGPGKAGENVLVRGVDWAALRPGTRLRLGTALAELSSWAAPCKKNAAWFAGGDFTRMDHDRHPGWSRAYALVLEDGVIRPGDEVIVEP